MRSCFILALFLFTFPPDEATAIVATRSASSTPDGEGVVDYPPPELVAKGVDDSSIEVILTRPQNTTGISQFKLEFEATTPHEVMYVSLYQSSMGVRSFAPFEDVTVKASSCDLSLTQTPPNCGKAIETTCKTLQSQPVDVKARAGKSSIALSWTPPSNTAGIEVYVAQAVDLKSSSTDVRMCSTNKGGTSCTISGLATSTRYLVHVKACNALPESEGVICSRPLTLDVTTEDVTTTTRTTTTTTTTTTTRTTTSTGKSSTITHTEKTPTETTRQTLPVDEETTCNDNTAVLLRIFIPIVVILAIVIIILTLCLIMQRKRKLPLHETMPADPEYDEYLDADKGSVADFEYPTAPGLYEIPGNMNQQPMSSSPRQRAGIVPPAKPPA